MIDLRVLTPDDWRVWRALRLAALADSPEAFGSRLADWQGAGDREDRWRSRLAIPGSRAIVAQLDDRPVGMLAGVPAGEDAVELVSMWVGPAARGHGVADHLIRAMEQWALDAGARVLRLCVTPGNERAAACYRRHGFAETGELGDLTHDGVTRQRVMAKTLMTKLFTE